MDDNELRQVVKLLYPLSKKWHKRVDQMPIAQVYQIHLRQCRIQDYERDLQEKKSQLRIALLDEGTSRTDQPCLQGTLF